MLHTNLSDGSIFYSRMHQELADNRFADKPIIGIGRLVHWYWLIVVYTSFYFYYQK